MLFHMYIYKLFMKNSHFVLFLTFKMVKTAAGLSLTEKHFIIGNLSLQLFCTEYFAEE